MTLQLRHNVQSAASKPPKKRRKVIDVEQYVAADEHEVSIWMETKHFTLLQEDCEILLNPCEWLNSSLIASAQILMKEQYELRRSWLTRPLLWSMHGLQGCS